MCSPGSGSGLGSRAIGGCCWHYVSYLLSLSSGAQGRWCLVCDRGGPLGAASVGSANPGVPGSADEALEMVMAGLTWLAEADMAEAPAVVQAECLRGLERAASVHAAARATVRSAFDTGGGFEDDGSRSAPS